MGARRSWLDGMVVVGGSEGGRPREPGGTRTEEASIAVQILTANGMVTTPGIAIIHKRLGDSRIPNPRKRGGLVSENKGSSFSDINSWSWLSRDRDLTTRPGQTSLPQPPILHVPQGGRLEHAEPTGCGRCRRTPAPQRSSHVSGYVSGPANERPQQPRTEAQGRARHRGTRGARVRWGPAFRTGLAGSEGRGRSG